MLDVLHRQQRAAAAAESLTKRPGSEGDNDISLTDDEGPVVTDGYDYDVLAELSHDYLEVVNKVRNIIK